MVIEELLDYDEALVMHDGRHKVHSKSISCVFIESLDDDAENEVETTTRKESRSNDKDGKDEVMEDLDGLIENEVMEEVQPSGSKGKENLALRRSFRNKKV